MDDLLKEENEALRQQLEALKVEFATLENEYMVENLTLESLTKIQAHNGHPHTNNGSCQESISIMCKLLLDFFKSLKEQKMQIDALKRKLRDNDQKARNEILKLKSELEETYSALENAKLKANIDKKFINHNISQQQDVKFSEPSCIDSKALGKTSEDLKQDTKQIHFAEIVSSPSLAKSRVTDKKNLKDSLHTTVQTNSALHTNFSIPINGRSEYVDQKVMEDFSKSNLNSHIGFPLRVLLKSGANMSNHKHGLAKCRSNIDGKSPITGTFCKKRMIVSSEEFNQNCKTGRKNTLQSGNRAPNKLDGSVQHLASFGSTNCMKSELAWTVLHDLHTKNPVMVLKELCDKHFWPPPLFTLVQEFGPSHFKKFIYMVKVNELECKSSAALTKKEAKANAAEACIKLLVKKAVINGIV